MTSLTLLWRDWVSF